MKKLCFIIGSLFLLSASIISAQENLIEVYEPIHIPNKKPIPYPYIREADVVWTKTIWRIVDLRQKQNLSLYYPIQPIGTRMNLIDIILWGVDNEGLTAYSTDDDLNEFKTPLTKEVIDKVMGAGIDTVRKIDFETGATRDTIVDRPRRTDEVKQLIVKERWYFDKQHSMLRVQIVGLCPIRLYYKIDQQTGEMMPDLRRTKTFWIYFPEVRSLLSRYEVFNFNNDAQRVSFDDFLWQRRFTGFVFRETNVYQNRTVNEYTMGIDMQYEGEDIQAWMAQFEHDLWEF